MVEASRQFTVRLNELMRDAGAPAGYPLVIWRDRDGFMKACACADSRSWAFIRDDFDAPDNVAPTGVAEPGPAIPPTTPVPGDGTPESLPYPTLGPIPPAGQAIPPAQPGTAPSTTPGRPTTPRAPAQPTAPPQPTQQEDTTFF